MENIQSIDLRLISPSTLNPRKFINQSSIIELANSIHDQGLLQPICVRPTGFFSEQDGLEGEGTYEIVYGYRRYCATKHNAENFNKSKEIDCLVKDFTDDEALDAMITENLQRIDIKPLEESMAFVKLYERGLSCLEISARFGKSELFVRMRIKLNDLIEPLKVILDGEELSLSHAFELCKLEDDIQTSIYNEHYAPELDAFNKWNLLTVAELKEKLNTKFLVLANADFDKSECATCQYNTNNAVSLFAGYDEDNCTNAGCFHKKKEQHILAMIQDCKEQDVPVMVKGGSEKKVQQLKEMGVEPVEYWSGKMDMKLYPLKPIKDVNDTHYNEEEFENDFAIYEKDNADFDKRMIEQGYTRAYTIGMIRTGNKFVYYKEVEVAVQAQQSEMVVTDKPLNNGEEELEKLLKKDLRNLELMKDKIVEDTKDMFLKSNYTDREDKLNDVEETILMGAILNLTTNVRMREMKKDFDKSIEYTDNVLGLTVEERNVIKRCFIKQLVAGTSVSQDKDVQNMLINLSKDFYGQDAETIAEKYRAEYNKRKERIVIRIKVINGEKLPEKEVKEKKKK